MNTINGRHLGHVENVISMTELSGSLIALTSDHKLLSRSRFEEDKLKPWTAFGDISFAGRAIAALPKTGRQQNNWTYIATSSDRLMRRGSVNSTQFTDFGEANGVVAMAAAFGQLYAATNDNKLWRRDAFSQGVSWDPIGHANNVVAIGAIGGIPIGADYLGGWLVAATNEGNTGTIWMRDNRPSDATWAPISDFGGKITAMTAVSVNHWSRPGLRKVLLPVWGVDVQIVGEVYTVTENGELWFGEAPRPPWPFLSRDRIGTEDGADLIEYTIKPDAVSGDKIELVLCLGSDVTWKKTLELWGAAPIGRKWEVVAEGTGIGRNVLLARERDGLRLTFAKAKAFGEMTPVYTLGNLSDLTPGSRVTFQWLKD
jgi:hypothetical protein